MAAGEFYHWMRLTDAANRFAPQSRSKRRRSSCGRSVGVDDRDDYGTMTMRIERRRSRQGATTVEDVPATTIGDNPMLPC
jgi:hypothetical protein